MTSIGSLTIPFLEGQRQVSQEFAALAQRLESRNGLIGQLSGSTTAAIDTQKLGVRPFAQPRVFTNAFAQFRFITLNVKQVVHNLKRQSYSLAIAVKRCDELFRCLGDCGTHPERSAKQRPGLAAVNGFKRGQSDIRWAVTHPVRFAPLRQQICHLPGYHT
jgi:hypothetical protein